MQWPNDFDNQLLQTEPPLKAWVCDLELDDEYKELFQHELDYTMQAYKENFQEIWKAWNKKINNQGPEPTVNELNFLKQNATAMVASSSPYLLVLRAKYHGKVIDGHMVQNIVTDEGDK